MIKILHGENEFDISMEISKLKSSLFSPGSMDSNLTIFSDNSIEASYLKSVVSTVPFLSDYRLVVIENLLYILDSNEKKSSINLQELVEILKNCPPSTHVIFKDEKKLKSSGRVLKSLMDFAEIKEVSLPKGRQINFWIKSRLSQINGKASDQAISKLTLLLGNNLRLIDQELKKLVLFCDGKSIQTNDVNLIITEARDINIFSAIDYALQKKTNLALKSFVKLLTDGLTVSSIVSMVYRQIRLLILVKEIMRREKNHEQIGKAIGINSTYAIRKLIEQSKIYTFNQLFIILKKLLEMDLLIKTGQIDENIALEIIVSELSTNA